MEQHTKACRRCKAELPESHFYGRERACKKCRYERAKYNRKHGIRKRTSAEVISRGNRVCTVCQKEKLTSEFWNNNAKCKPCYRDSYREGQLAYAKAKRAADPEAARQRDRAYYRRWKSENPESWRRAIKNGRLKEAYGITIQQFDEMVLDCDARCHICNEKQADSMKMHVDHCHSTGRIRGLLCGTCNVGLGMFHDDINILNAAITYLRERGQF